MLLNYVIEIFTTGGTQRRQTSSKATDLVNSYNGPYPAMKEINPVKNPGSGWWSESAPESNSLLLVRPGTSPKILTTIRRQFSWGISKIRGISLSRNGKIPSKIFYVDANTKIYSQLSPVALPSIPKFVKIRQLMSNPADRQTHKGKLHDSLGGGNHVLKVPQLCKNPHIPSYATIRFFKYCTSLLRPRCAVGHPIESLGGISVPVILSSPSSGVQEERPRGPCRAWALSPTAVG